MPNAVTEQYTSRGLSCAAAKKSMPSFSMTPARRLWTKTSARWMSRLRMSIPASRLRSTARLFLFRLNAKKMALSRAQNGGPQARASSPRPGRSTLMTSAPMSPSVCVQNGPATFWVRSTTTIPSSGNGTDEV